MMRSLLLLIALASFSLLGDVVKASETGVPQRKALHFSAAEMDRRNPERDARVAIKKGDLDFVGVYGLTVLIPGAQEYYDAHQNSVGVKVIKGTSDYVENNKVQRLNEAGQRYARRYNLVILKHLESQ